MTINNKVPKRERKRRSYKKGRESLEGKEEEEGSSSRSSKVEKTAVVDTGEYRNNSKSSRRNSRRCKARVARDEEGEEIKVLVDVCG